MALTAYDLPSLTTVVGTFSFRLYSETAGLTKPAVQTIVDVGETTETMDLDLGLGQFANMTIDVRDDYSTYSEGFWYKVLNGSWRLRIYLDEGSGDTFYFFGIPQQERVVWTEHYVGSTRLRTARITLVSIEAVLFDVATEDWMNEVYARRRTAVNTATSTIYEAVNIAEMFSTLIAASGLNGDTTLTGTLSSSGTTVTGSGTAFTSELVVGSVITSDGQERIVATITDDDTLTTTAAFSPALSGNAFTIKSYSSSDATLALNVDQDFVYTEGANDWAVTQLYIPVTVSSSSVVTKTKYFDSTEATFLGESYPKAGGLFSAILRNFAIIARASYSTASGRHLLTIRQRIRGYTAITPSGLKTSQIDKSFALLGDAARASALSSADFVWFSNLYSDGAPLASAPPDYVDFDLDVTCPFINDATVIATDEAGFALHGGSAITSAALIDGCEYYNYNTDALVVASVGNAVLEGVAGHQFHRFSNAFSRIVRKYKWITPHTGVHVGAYVSINDGIAAADYYANNTTKIPRSGEVEIEWIKE